MVLGLTTVSDATIERVLADPPLVWRVLAPEDPEVYEDARRATDKKAGLLSRLFRGGKKAPGDELELGDGEGASTDADKAWHGVHYLLTGTAWEGSFPLGFIVSGGREVPTIDAGYSPPRVFTASETSEIRQALATLSPEELRKRFNPEDMTEKEIYPEIWTRDPAEEDTLGYLMDAVETLRGFLAEAVDHKLGILIHIS